MIALARASLPSKICFRKYYYIDHNYISINMLYLMWVLGNIPLSSQLCGMLPQQPLVKYIRDGINGCWHLSVRTLRFLVL